MYINRPSTKYLGLFGYVGEIGEIHNLGIEGGSVSGRDRMGALAGHNLGKINNCYATAEVNATEIKNGPMRAGGLVGTNSSKGIMTNSYATGNVTSNKRIERL